MPGTLESISSASAVTVAFNDSKTFGCHFHFHWTVINDVRVRNVSRPEIMIDKMANQSSRMTSGNLVHRFSLIADDLRFLREQEILPH